MRLGSMHIPGSLPILLAGSCVVRRNTRTSTTWKEPNSIPVPIAQGQQLLMELKLDSIFLAQQSCKTCWPCYEDVGHGVPGVPPLTAYREH